MATNNFYKVNASKYFVVLENYEQPVLDDEFNETDEMETVCMDEMEVADELDYFKSLLKDSLKEGMKFYDYQNYDGQYDNRNFPAHYLGTVYTSKKFGDIDCEVIIHCFVRSGYYEGANMDWELQINVDTFSLDNTDDIPDTFESVYSDMNAGLLKIQGRNCMNWAEKARNTLVEYVEGIFTQCSTPYSLQGVFSNGEAIYKKL